MIGVIEPQVSIRCDPTNPGQFLACCGILELTDRRRDGGAKGWFADGGRRFCLGADVEMDGAALHSLLAELSSCAVSNTMNPDELRRRAELSAMSGREIDAARREDEKKALESLWRESPVIFGAPFDFTVDWHQDDRGRGSTFKTWAGQQSIIDIARGMQAAARATLVCDGAVEQVLMSTSRGLGLPFNFDSDLGTQAAPLDVGFSFDPLPTMSLAVRPMLELCALIGLQRFRPARVGKENRYQYAQWKAPLRPSVASAMASCSIDSLERSVFEFRLLYRTKYLKSFLSAKPVSR